MKVLKLTCIHSKLGVRRFVVIPAREVVEAVQYMDGDYGDVPEGTQTLLWRENFDDAMFIVESISEVARQLESAPEI